MRALSVLVLACLVLAVAGCAAGTGVLTSKDDGTTVELAEGDELVVELESNPSTGYAWQVVEVEGASQRGESEFTEGATDVVGAPGVERLTFVREGTGPGVIELEYRRVWETTATPEGTWSVTLAGD